MNKIFLSLLFVCGSYVAMAQHTITGIIYDQDSVPLIGAAIQEKGTNNGTITDVDGRYKLELSSKDAKVLVRYVGYGTKEIVPGDQGELNITLDAGVTLHEIQIVGTRSRNRTATETPVPIDIIELEQIKTQNGQLDINTILQYVAPSFNANKQSGADGADHIEPATLRGLGPDQTLVLINGKRRHQSSMVNIFGSRGRGNTGTDLNTIPAAAIERIEILRDGASAQYGSDAIAGVINIVLKNSTEEFTGNVSMGAFNANPPSEFDVQEQDTRLDGQTINLSGNYGIKLGKDGFANFTLDYLSSDFTNRPTDPDKFEIYREKYGNAAAQNFAAYLNAALPIGENSSLYSTVGFNFRNTDSYAWTRTADSDRNIPEIYPNGFNPLITSNVTDNAVTVGFKTQNRGWEIDISNSYGANQFNYIIENTLNASLLEKSPTRFDAGGFSLQQNTTGIYFSKYFDQVLAGINIAYGAEYRIDNYSIFAGEEGSYRNYGLIDTLINDQIVTFDKLGRAAGSQGFPGFQPGNELDEYRTNLGAYLDTEFDISKRFMVGATLRYESYSDFGDTWNGKLASRLAVVDGFALRGAVSTGFRAPSLVQYYFNTTYTDFINGVAIDKIVAKNNSPLTRALGIPELKEETATNASLGFTAQFGDFSATVDGYYVAIQDRIVLTGSFEDTDPDIGEDLQKIGVSAAQFFTNALDTETMGLDIVLGWSKSYLQHTLYASLAGNFNQMTLGEVKTSPALEGKEDIYFGPREQKFLLASAPNSKINFTLNYGFNKFKANLSFIRFGKVVIEDFNATDDIYEPKVVTDMSVGYAFSKNISLYVGGANIFNVYPTAQDTDTETGGLWDAVQMGFGGAYYFSKLNIRF